VLNFCVDYAQCLFVVLSFCCSVNFFSYILVFHCYYEYTKWWETPEVSSFIMIVMTASSSSVCASLMEINSIIDSISSRMDPIILTCSKILFCYIDWRLLMAVFDWSGIANVRDFSVKNVLLLNQLFGGIVRCNSSAWSSWVMCSYIPWKRKWMPVAC
jgi:hypothetical protein